MNTARPPFIVDNSETDWRVRNYLREWCGLSRQIDIATGWFEIGALLCMEDEWQKVDKIRLLMGDEVSRRTKSAFEEGLRRIRCADGGWIACENSPPEPLTRGYQLVTSTRDPVV